MTDEHYLELKQKLRLQQAKIDKIEDDFKARELSYYKWGVRALGTVVIVMGGWIWSQVGHIFDYTPGGKP